MWYQHQQTMPSPGKVNPGSVGLLFWPPESSTPCSEVWLIVHKTLHGHPWVNQSKWLAFSLHMSDSQIYVDPTLSFYVLKTPTFFPFLKAIPIFLFIISIFILSHLPFQFFNICLINLLNSFCWNNYYSFCFSNWILSDTSHWSSFIFHSLIYCLRKTQSEILRHMWLAQLSSIHLIILKEPNSCIKSLSA